MLAVSHIPTTAAAIIAQDLKGFAAARSAVQFGRSAVLGTRPVDAKAVTDAIEAEQRPTPQAPVSVAYEVLRVRPLSASMSGLFANDHWRRLETSLRHLGFADATEAERYVQRSLADVAFPALIDANLRVAAAEECNVKVVVFQTPQGGLDAAMYFIASHYPPASWYQPPVAEGEGTNSFCRLAVLPDSKRLDPNAKAVTVAMAAMRQAASSLMKQAATFEVLLCHPAADAQDPLLVPEGSRSNFLLIAADGAVEMSLDDDVLIGVTLTAVVKILNRPDAPAPLRRKKLRVEDVFGARAVAMLGTSVGVLPVHEIVGFDTITGSRLTTPTPGTRVYGSAADPTVQWLIDQYREASTVARPSSSL